MPKRTGIKPHRWVGAFVSTLTHEQAAEYQTWVDGAKRGVPPKVQYPSRITDVYCFECRKSYRDAVGKPCDPIKLIVGKSTHQMSM